LNLGSSSLEVIANVKSFKLFKRGDEEWLAYHLINNELVLRNLKDNKEQKLNNVLEYLISKDGHKLVLKKEVKTKDGISQSLSWINTSTNYSSTIFEGRKLSNITVNDDFDKLAFIGEDTANSILEKSIWYISKEGDTAQLLMNNNEGVDSDLKLDRIVSFNKEGTRLFIKLKKKEHVITHQNAASLDVWSYTDSKLQSRQLYELSPDPFDISTENKLNYIGVINLKNHVVIRLQYENEKIWLFNKNIIDHFALITQTKGGDKYEINWNDASRESCYVTSTLTGERIKIPIKCVLDLSPNEKYVIGTTSYFEGLNDDLLSYCLSTKKTLNITKFLAVPKKEVEVFNWRSFKSRNLTIAAWLKNDEAILVYDKFDIWLMDPTCKKAPVNLTNSYGRKMNIIFRISGQQDIYRKQLAYGDVLLLNAFNLTNKDCGFYKIIVGKIKDPEKLAMGPYYYNHFFSEEAPIKARDTSIYIIERESAKETNNYFSTKDFKTFRQLTYVYPEKKYNWLTSELHVFKTVDGNKDMGILYKPENFNPQKKYPVIIHYYETSSNQLNKYRKPEGISDFINIPWFVSREYLVFVPDIHYTTSAPGLSAYNSIVGAKKYLDRLKWVNSGKIGIQGHSWGGFETNYLITHTNIFAAALSSSGVCDLISFYGSLTAKGYSEQFFCELHQYRIGYNLWEKPDLYIENSPIFYAKRVTTPLLMMNNKKDGIVPFAQGVEFFTALRRLRKKVWMLQYDNEFHTLIKEDNIKQHTIRVTQFFDHYLKGAGTPKWMVHGISASMKGVDDGLEIDY
jgi:dienelactone hydrolase